MRSLSFKLTLAFLLVSLTGIALVAALVWGFTSSEFNQYVITRGLNDYTKAVTAYYKTNGSWDGVADELKKQALVADEFPFVISQGRWISTTPAAGSGGILYQPVQKPILEEQGSGNQGYGEISVGEPGSVKPNSGGLGSVEPGPGQSFIQIIGGPGGGRRDIFMVPFVLVDTKSRVIVATGPFHQYDLLPANKFPDRVAVTVDNQPAGFVVVTGKAPTPNPIEQRFLTRMNQALLITAVLSGLIAVFLGLVLARTITRPVRDLTLAARALAGGKLNQPVPVRSKDELGQLTESFNSMSAGLDRANRLRKQMTADIAHDLRTPLSVITGYLEGLKDGVIKPTPRRFTAMHDEAVYLQRLVEDLRTLSLADAGELSITVQPTHPAEVVERLDASFQHLAEQKQVQWSAEVEPDLPDVSIDPERMQQALGNLAANALRYTPPGGTIHASARREAGGVCFEVQDSGAGIDAETLPRVFDRFYRGDDSRQEGGSGLGLAIARSVIELMGGSIHAASAGENQGSTFTILVPAL